MSIITEIVAENGGTVRIHLSEALCGNFSPALCERLEPEIWDFHYRFFPFEYTADGCYCLDIRTAVRTLEYDSEKVFDLFLVDMQSQKKLNVVTNIDKCVVDLNRCDTDTVWGKLVCQCYKNAKGGISAKLKLANPPSFYARNLRVDGGRVRFEILSPDIKNARFYFGRRTVAGPSRKYDFTVPVDADMESDIFVVNEEISKLLGGLSAGGSEKWELVADACGLQFAVAADAGFASEVFEISPAIRAGFGVGKSGAVTVTTLENDNRDKPKVRVAVIGSCFARQTFNSLEFFNSDYKRFYECGLTGYHMSFSSMMSDPIPFNSAELIGAYQSDLNAHGEGHFTKDFISRLKKYSPDYLIVENYVNISAALIQVGSDGYIDENYYLADTPAFRGLKNTRRVRAEGEEHFEIYKRKLAEFKSAIENVIDGEHIVLVRTQPALYKKENGKITEWESSQTIRFRRNLWERYDSFFLTLFPRAKVIDMRDDSKYISEKSDHLKFAPSHFGSNYYKDLLDKFNKIVLQHFIERMDIDNGKHH